MKIPELGVGIIYFPGFERVLESNPELVSVIEIEPQTFWYKNRNGSDSFSFDGEQVDYLASLHQPKLFHGVGFPVGGRIQDSDHIPFLQRMMRRLEPAWLSEHLSFNTITLDDGRPCNTNFLLPPLQTEEGVRLAADNIKTYRSQFDRPFAFETGVNYLAPKAFEMEDGRFIDAVARAADTYILLDLHNLLANHRNGRQDIYALLDQIDLQRVLQIHLAGGFYSGGYYLDAHSGVSSDEVLEVFEYAVERLPELRAVTFEMLPDYLDSVDEDDLRIQLEEMNRVWDKRGRKASLQPVKEQTRTSTAPDPPTVEEWEYCLGRLAISREAGESDLAQSLEDDPGLDIIRGLVEKFKASMIVSSLKLTSRYLMLKEGLDGFNDLLRSFWKESSPRLFASDNGLAFARWLSEHAEAVREDPLLEELLQYEYASLQTLLDGEEREIALSQHPRALIEPLSRGQLPEPEARGHYLITITPEDAPEREEVRTVYHS